MRWFNEPEMYTKVQNSESSWYLQKLKIFATCQFSVLHKSSHLLRNVLSILETSKPSETMTRQQLVDEFLAIRETNTTNAWINVVVAVFDEKQPNIPTDIVYMIASYSRKKIDIVSQCIQLIIRSQEKIALSVSKFPDASVNTLTLLRATNPKHWCRNLGSNDAYALWYRIFFGDERGNYSNESVSFCAKTIIAKADSIFPQLYKSDLSKKLQQLCQKQLNVHLT